MSRIVKFSIFCVCVLVFFILLAAFHKPAPPDIPIETTATSEVETTKSQPQVVMVQTQEYFENYVKNNYSEELVILAKIVYGESRGIKSQTEQACIIWTVLNRYDNGYWGDSIKKVALAPHQFGYVETSPMVDDYGRSLYDLAVDVMVRWYRERMYNISIGRVLPADYFYYWGDGAHNYFTKEYRSNIVWDYQYFSPYEV